MVILGNGLKDKAAHRGDGQPQAGQSAALLPRGGEHAFVDDAAAAVGEVVGIEYLAPTAEVRDVDGAILARNGGEVDDYNDFLALAGDALPDEGAFVGVVLVQPAVAGLRIIGILVPQGGGLQVQVVERGEVVLEPRVGVLVEEEPVELAAFVPLGELTELAAHEP